MRSRSMAIVAAGVVAACAPRAPAASLRTGNVTLEASPCYGTCPAYRVSIYADGNVEFEGSLYAVAHGHARIAADSAQALLRRFTDSRFADLDTNYAQLSLHCGSFATDGPGYRLSLQMATTRHAVSYYGGCFPDPHSTRGEQDRSDYRLLRSLAAAIDSIVDTKRWFRQTRDR